MNLARLIARIFLGAAFTFAGASIFFVTPPPVPGLAGVFNDVFFKSHWALFVGAAQLVLGVLLLVNRYVPLALIILAAFVYNSFAFHITMAPSALWAPIVVLLLWLFVAWPYRRLFAPILAARAQTE